MNLLVFIILVGIILGLIKFKVKNMLIWVITWWLSIYIFLKFGFTAPLPVSIIAEYMVITTLSLVIYVASSKERFEQVRQPIIVFITDKKYVNAVNIAIIVVPALVMLQIYLGSQTTIQPPFFGRTVHPAPPTTITFKGKKIDLIKGENPIRELEKTDPAKFKDYLLAGKKVYYQNCFYCHGDRMEGQGLFAPALDPIPTNFADPATIAMLQENFLFWRIAKGGIGLPAEGGPWASAMPAWEDFLTEDDIWNVTAYLYDYTDQKPRAQEHHE